MLCIYSSFVLLTLLKDMLLLIILNGTRQTSLKIYEKFKMVAKMAAKMV